MNLFESKIADIKTTVNSAQLEAVTKIFNILFEDQMPTAQPSTQNARKTLCDNVRKILGCAEQVHGDYLKQSIDSYKLAQLENILNEQTSYSDAELFQKIVKIVFGQSVGFSNKTKVLIPAASQATSGMLYDSSVDATQFRENVIKYHIDKASITAFVAYVRALQEFNSVITTQFTSSQVPDMYKPISSSKREGQYIKPDQFNVRGTIQDTGEDTSTEETNEDNDNIDVINPDTGASIQGNDEQQPNGTSRTLTGTIKPKPGKPAGNKPTKPEPPKAKEQKPSIEFVDANIDPNKKTQVRSIVMSNLSNVNDVADYLRDSWNTLLKVKGWGKLSTEGISINVDPSDNSVSMTSDIESSRMKDLNYHMVAMYCLYMDAKKEGKVNRNSTTITLPVADCLANDNVQGAPTLLSLCKFKDANAIMMVPKPSIDDLKYYLRRTMDEPSKEALAAAISQAIKGYSSADIEQYTELTDKINKAKELDAQTDTESATEQNKTSETTPEQKQLEQLTDSFNNYVANVFQVMMSKTNGTEYDDDDLGSMFDEETTDYYEQALNALKSKNIYNEVMTYMKTHIGLDNEPQIIKPTNADDKLDAESKQANWSHSSYNQQAEQLLTYCRNELRNREMANNQFASQANDSYASADDLAAAADVFGTENQFADDMIRGWGNAR